VSVLGHLYRRGALTPGELAAADRLQPQSLTRVLAELERAGLAAREQDPADRRRHRIRLTDEGLAALLRDARPRDEWLAGAMERELSPVERELLRLAAPLLERLAEAGSGAAAATFRRRGRSGVGERPAGGAEPPGDSGEQSAGGEPQGGGQPRSAATLGHLRSTGGGARPQGGGEPPTPR
jgi:DNA-binding MarR family transcriptional regulator